MLEHDHGKKCMFDWGNDMAVSELFTSLFWAATMERAVRSFAASLASILTADGTGILDTDWGQKLSVAAMAAVVSVLLALAGGSFGGGNGPSFLGAENTDKRTRASSRTRPRKRGAAGRRLASKRGDSHAS
jgi:hypothetical protein